MSLAAAIASSSDENEAIGATGPKISSLSTRASGVTPPSTVGSKKYPAPSTLPPPTTAAGALGDGVVDQLGHLRRAGRRRSAGRRRRPPRCRGRPSASPCGPRAWTRTRPPPSSATWKRLAEVQASPMFRILAIIAPSTAASRSASSKIRNGALPPSSIETLSTLSAAWAISLRPTSVDPVKRELSQSRDRRSPARRRRSTRSS